MARRDSFIVFLLACFLFAAFQSNCTLIKGQASKSANFNPGSRSLQLGSRLPIKHPLPNWGDQKSAHKTPSGPNPVGNQRPPTKT